MTKLEQLEQDIMRLSRPELAELTGWLQSYLGDEWDRQIEADAEGGKLDFLAREALADHEAAGVQEI